jgi:hypothetical protein
MGSPFVDTTPDLFNAFFAIVGVLFVGAIVFGVVAVTRNWRAARDAGLDPLAAETQIAGRLYNSSLLADGRSPQERLSELEGLRANGLVDQAEYEQIRSRILGAL